MERFGEKLRALRTREGLTLRELGTSLDISHGYIARLEYGTKTPSTFLVLKIADFFGVTTDELMRDGLELDVGTDEAA